MQHTVCTHVYGNHLLISIIWQGFLVILPVNGDDTRVEHVTGG
jgi:hypothetical protein